jgi:hypothetical protein
MMKKLLLICAVFWFVLTGCVTWPQLLYTTEGGVRVTIYANLNKGEEVKIVKVYANANYYIQWSDGSTETGNYYTRYYSKYNGTMQQFSRGFHAPGAPELRMVGAVQPSL